MYSQYTKQTLINSDPLCETLINCKVVRCLMISSNATDRVNMQSQTSDSGLQRWYYQLVVFCRVTPGRWDNTWISHRLWLGAGNETLKTEMGLTRNVIQTSGQSVQHEEIEILCVVWAPPILNILTHTICGGSTHALIESFLAHTEPRVCWDSELLVFRRKQCEAQASCHDISANNYPPTPRMCQ